MRAQTESCAATDTTHQDNRNGIRGVNDATEFFYRCKRFLKVETIVRNMSEYELRVNCIGKNHEKTGVINFIPLSLQLVK